MNIPESEPTAQDLEQQVATPAEIHAEAPPEVPDVTVPENAYRFTEGDSRIYMDRSLVVHRGDVVVWPDGPPDTCWEHVN